jgi:hypothetical protein
MSLKETNLITNTPILQTGRRYAAQSRRDDLFVENKLKIDFRAP